MSKVVNIIFQTLLFLFLVFSFSNGTVYFIKNINKDENTFLSILLSLLVISLFTIIKQYKLLEKYYIDYYG